MIKSRIAVAGALLAVAGAANAGTFTVTPTIATDYDFRGVSQTNPDQDGMDPAFQLGGTYAFDNGVYAGIWGSNVDYGAWRPERSKSTTPWATLAATRSRASATTSA